MRETGGRKEDPHDGPGGRYSQGNGSSAKGPPQAVFCLAHLPGRTADSQGYQEKTVIKDDGSAFYRAPNRVNNHAEGGEADNCAKRVEKETHHGGSAGSAPEEKWQHTNKDESCEDVHVSEDGVCFEKNIQPQQVRRSVGSEWPQQSERATQYDSDADNDA